MAPSAVEIQRTFDWDNVESCSTAQERASYQGMAHCRTGELVREIVGPLRESFLAISFGDRLEQDIHLERLPELTLEELARISPEFGPREHRALLAAVELGRRVAEAKLLPSKAPRICSSASAIEYCKSRFQRLTQDGLKEEFHVVTLNTKNRVMDSHLVTVGTLDASLVHPREVFRPAIKDAAASIIAVHNHPSGDPTPSREDLAVTQRLETAGKTLGIELLDHIVVAREGAVSVRESMR